MENYFNDWIAQNPDATLEEAFKAGMYMAYDQRGDDAWRAGLAEGMNTPTEDIATDASDEVPVIEDANVDNK